LKEIVAKETVQLPEQGNKFLKADYIRAIVSCRYPDGEANLSDDDMEELPARTGQQQESNEQMAPAVQLPVDDSETDTQATIMGKKLLAVNTVKELKAIAAVEAIATNKCSTKAHYIDAIYVARSLKKL
jgi:hypothetical protein